MEEDKMRFSDVQLENFYGEFKKHVAHYEERIKTDDARHEAMAISQQANTQALQELTKATKDVVDLYGDLQGAARIGDRLQKFGLWLAKWGVVGAAAAATWEFLLKNLPR